MIEEKRINHPSTMYGMTNFYKELQEAILDGYRVKENLGNSFPHWAARHAITVFKETPDNPLEKLDNPKLKKDEVIKIANEDFGLEVPEGLKTPNEIKKFIRESTNKVDSQE